MKQAGILALIGMLSGIVLAIFLKAIEILTGNTVYYLLFHVDYVPVLRSLRPVSAVELCFHFGTCIISVIVLYYLLKQWKLEKSALAYLLVIGLGSGCLFFLTELSEHTPPVTDIVAWSAWVAGHALFSLTAGILIKKWL